MATGQQSNNFYAPRPQGPPATHFYPPKDESVLKPPSLRPSPNPSDEGYKSDAYGKPEERTAVDYREVARTPSPTPSEADALANKTRSCNPAAMKKYFTKEYLKQPRKLATLLVTILLIAILIVFVVEEDNIVKALQPFANWMRRTPGGWLIPIAVMIVLSFPPLVGHEIVAILCGDVYGLGIGFLVVAAGTILGELVTYYTFRYCCRARGEKSEQKSLKYALLSEVIRRGGFKMAVMVRYGAIPAHITTAIFATCGMSVFTFLVAALLSLPKQLSAVYLGTGSGSQSSSHIQAIVKICVIIITIIMTMISMRYVNKKIDAIKQEVIYKRRKTRQAKLHGLDDAYVAEADPDDLATTPLVPRRRDSSDDSEYGMKRPQPAPSRGPVAAQTHRPQQHYPPQLQQFLQHDAQRQQQVPDRYSQPQRQGQLPQQQRPQQQQQYQPYSRQNRPPPSVQPGQGGARYDDPFAGARYDDPYGGRDAYAVGGLKTANPWKSPAQASSPPPMSPTTAPASFPNTRSPPPFASPPVTHSPPPSFPPHNMRSPLASPQTMLPAVSRSPPPSIPPLSSRSPPPRTTPSGARSPPPRYGNNASGLGEGGY